MEVYNSSGHVAFQISDIDQVKRFLSLGSDNGTYYIAERDLVALNVQSIQRVLDSEKDRCKLLDMIEDYAKNAKCKKQEPLVYLLACCCTYKIDDVDVLDFRSNAYNLVSTVCFIPTTLFMFINYCKQICKANHGSSGWNNLHKRAISKWYKDKHPSSLAYQVTKYKDRCGYSHKDVFRLAHVKPDTLEQEWLFKYITKGYESVCQENMISVVAGFVREYEVIKNSTDEQAVIAAICKWKFAREHIPSVMLKHAAIWAALLPHMPDIAMLRNLNKMTICGLFQDDGYVNMIEKRILGIRDMHPMHLLIALRMYSKGSGHRGSLSWAPNSQIVKALDSQFYKLFDKTRPTGKRICVAMDVSASMLSAHALGSECMSCAEACCALAMVMKASDPHVDVMGFSSGFVPLQIDPTESIEINLRRISSLPFQSTDISLPFRYSLTHGLDYDAFIVLTDNETTFTTKPIDELRKYRTVMKIPSCKLVVVAMASNNFTIADPNDRNMLDVCGFDSSVPDVINEFIREEM